VISDASIGRAVAGDSPRAVARQREPSVSVRGLAKKYRLFDSPGQRLKEAINPFGRKYHREFWALQDITFDVPAGVTLGIIGRNGSGKSTLLQTICGVLRPTAGTVTVGGRIAALLELGAGFNPELTGRQNVMLNGVVQGYSRKEIAARLPHVEAFAEIGGFFDQPVKLYSSGMFVRLAFAAAINVDPDILIVDEALAVGDAMFQYKCYNKFHEFQESGKTILLVSHSTDSIVRHCDQALLLEGGRIAEAGQPKVVVNHYLDLLFSGTKRTYAPDPVVVEPNYCGFCLIHHGTRFYGLPSAVADGLDIGTIAIKLRAWQVDGSCLTAGALDEVKRLVDRAVSAGAADAATMPVAVHPSGEGELSAFLRAAGEVDRCPTRRSYNPAEYRYGDRRAEIVDYLLVADGECDVQTVVSGQPLDVYVKVHYHETIQEPMTGMAIKTLDGVDVYGISTKGMNIQLDPVEPSTVVFRWTVALELAPGDYFVDVGCGEYNSGKSNPLDRRYGLAHLVVQSDVVHAGLVRLATRFERIL
jgi:ABC-type polysaccharide/polyol phosphate transport system ATPase subunit